MTINGVETNALVFYDQTTKEVCALVTDDDIAIPSNCELAVFNEGQQPLFKEEDDMVKLKGAIIERW